MKRRSRGGGVSGHGHARHGAVTSEYRSWQGAIRRCHSETNKDYSRYGARGIVVCLRWFDSFEAFFADMGPKPSRLHSLDRIDFNKNYEPGNCRWALPKTQGENRRGVTMWTFGNETMTVPDWSKRLGIPKSVLQYRLTRGAPIEVALTAPRRHSYFTANGSTQRLADWARQIGIDPITILKRRRRGWTDEEALGFVSRRRR